MTEEISWAVYAAILNGADEMRFDFVWNEELWVYECEQEAAKLDMRFDIQWVGAMYQYLDDGRYGRPVTDGEW